MKKTIIISDSFKGSLSSKEISKIFTEKCNQYFPDATVISVPIADGGEGTVEAFASFIEGHYETISVKNLYLEDMEVKYYMSNDNVAFIEVASCAGLPLATNRNPSITSTFGVGEQIKDAIEKGAKKVILGLGGSATNDAGCGAASALGIKFFEKNRTEFIPTGNTLKNIAYIDINGAKELLKDVEIVAMCDIYNPMHGKQGAAYIYAKQKGADEKMIEELDENLAYLDEFLSTKLHRNVGQIKGSGAAGAFGAGAIAFMHARLKSGIETLLEAVKFDELLDGCDFVFTGEGKVDNQSFYGKAISGIAKHAKENNVPVIVITGSVTDNAESFIDKNLGITCMFTTTRMPLEFSKVKEKAKDFYSVTISNILSLIKASEKQD